jgi:hypothetical protein
MKKNRFMLLSYTLLLLAAACTKGPGVGGRASIKGKVYAHNYSNSFLLNDSGYIGGEKVYIKYGDEPGVGDDVDTDNTGTFYFPYLRKGKYTLYVYSKRLIPNAIDSAVVQTVTISDRTEEVELPQFTINTFKN